MYGIHNMMLYTPIGHKTPKLNNVKYNLFTIINI